MKQLRLFLSFLIFSLAVVSNKAVKPVVDNRMAMLQLEDSQSAYILFRLYTDIQPFIFFLVFGSLVILLYPEIKALSRFALKNRRVKKDDEFIDVN